MNSHEFDKTLFESLPLIIKKRLDYLDYSDAIKVLRLRDKQRDVLYKLQHFKFGSYISTLNRGVILNKVKIIMDNKNVQEDSNKIFFHFIKSRFIHVIERKNKAMKESDAKTPELKFSEVGLQREIDKILSDPNSELFLEQSRNKYSVSQEIILLNGDIVLKQTTSPKLKIINIKQSNQDYFLQHVDKLNKIAEDLIKKRVEKLDELTHLIEKSQGVPTAYNIQKYNIMPTSNKLLLYDRQKYVRLCRWVEVDSCITKVKTRIVITTKPEGYHYPINGNAEELWRKVKLFCSSHKLFMYSKQRLMMDVYRHLTNQQRLNIKKI